MVYLNERGAGLVIAILTVVALFALGTALVFLTRTDVNISKHQTLHVEALYVAEAGAEEALHRLGMRDPTVVTVNGTSMNAAIRDTAFPPDPNWKTRIFLCQPGAEPSPTGTDLHTCTIQDAGSWLEYSSADDITGALTIEHKWKDRDGDNTRDANEIVLYDGSQYPPENFSTGTPVEVITVTAKSATAERQIKVEATRFPLNVNARAALLCNEGVDVRGNVTVCGHDHALETPHYTMFPACIPHEHCSNRTACLATGCLTGVMTTGDPIDKRGTTDLDGHPFAEDTSSTNQFLSLAQMLGLEQEDLDEILAGADYTSAAADDPQEGITYINNAGGSDAMWNNGGGTGLLYVTGNLTTAGNFVWKGLLYVEGNYTIVGTPSIIGAVVVKGTSTWAFSGGNPCILYSSEALNYYLRQSLRYVKIGWKETSG